MIVKGEGEEPAGASSPALQGGSGQRLLCGASYTRVGQPSSLKEG